MISFWERENFLEYDFIIVGSGIVGLSTAISLKDTHAKARILILERGIWPSGASTRNAGFACFAKACEMLDDLELQPSERVAALVHERFSGLQLLRKRLGDEAIGFKNYGGFELIFKHETAKLDRLEYLNDLLRPYFDQDVFSRADERIEEFGFQNVAAIVYTPLEGQLNSGKMMSALSSKAQLMGISVITGAEVREIEEIGNGAAVSVKHSVLNDHVSFKASKVVLCTNALISKLLPQYKIVPGRGQVLVTEPLEGLRFKGTFHFDSGYYYFRNIGNRVLFGGGRNIDFETEQNDRFELNDMIQTRLEHYLSEVILPETEWKVDMRWSGIMGFEESKSPVVEMAGNHIAIGFSCNGMGVALGTATGEKLAKLIL